MDFYIQGLTLGLAYVAPIGMQNLFVINSALTQPRWRRFNSAYRHLFDITLAMACFSASADNAKYAAVQMAMLFIGGLVVAYIGWGLLKSKVSALADINKCWAGANRMAGVCGNVVQRAGRYRRHYAFGRV